MCASTETDMRESASDCTLASGEGFNSGRETSHPMSLKRPCPHPGNALYHTYGMLFKILPFALYESPVSVQALQSR
jgi:hypothetical protein